MEKVQAPQNGIFLITMSKGEVILLRHKHSTPDLQENSQACINKKKKYKNQRKKNNRLKMVAYNKNN